MKNYISSGKTLTLTAPSGGVVSGNAYLIGTLLVVASISVAEGLPFTCETEGVFELPKEATAAAFTEGELVYWDDTGKQCHESAIGRFGFGTAVETAVTAATTVKVKLGGRAVVAVA